MVVGLAAIFVGVVPIMTGAVCSVIGNRLVPIASWLIGISPVSMPFYAPGTLLSLAELPPEAARAVPRAFYFWLFVFVLVTVWLSVRLWAHRKRLAASVMDDGR